MLSLALFNEISSQRSGSDKIIKGDRAESHIDHNISYSCRCIRRGDISIKVKLRVLLIEDGLKSRNIKA